MSLVTVTGDPDKVCGFLDSLITAGNTINLIKKTKNSATYIVEYSAAGALSYLLLEDGSYLLLESGDKIILE